MRDSDIKEDRKIEGKKFVAYYRVSTKQQGRSGLGLEAQKSKISGVVELKKGELIGEFTDIESGTVDNRRGLRSAIEMCKETKATFVIADLSRLSRIQKFSMNLLDDLKVQKIRVISCDDPDLDDPVILGVKTGLIQKERELISQRTKAALAAKKAQGFKFGNPQNLTPEAVKKSAKVRKEKAKMAEYNLNAEEIIKDNLNLSLAKIADKLNRYGAKTAKGKKFTPCTVRNIIKLYGIERPGKQVEKK